MYQLSLGDSIAAGVGASTPARSYVALVANHESASFPGLVVENESCTGATTGSVIGGGDWCTYPAGSQLAQAEAFLAGHRGQVRYITIDIGFNNVLACLAWGQINVPCALNGLATVHTELPQIIAALHQAAPGVPVFGMDYYNPFVASWILGGSTGPGVAHASAALCAILNSALTQIYGAGGATPVDVQGAFAGQDFAMTGSVNGVSVPENVSRICSWTHMCDVGGEDVHPDDMGHARVADAFIQAIDRELRGGGLGTWMSDGAGGVHAVGKAGQFGSMSGQPINGTIADMAATSDGNGYWLAGTDGGVFAFGDAGFFGSVGGQSLNRPIVGIVPTTDDQGYWLVASDGGIFAFGDAAFLGSMGGAVLNQPVVGMVQTGSNRGYWLVASDGGIFTFGDAAFLGSMGSMPLNRPVVGVATTTDGNGYWMVASDGGVFAFGDALFYGSTGGIVLNKPIVGLAPSPDGHGYILGASDGGAFAFGSAEFTGSLGSDPPARPVVAIAST
jgi:lysophospholipase L1-like esterase